jgi:hypothetical protein
MLSRIYIQCFENNRGAEKVEVNYERSSVVLKTLNIYIEATRQNLQARPQIMKKLPKHQINQSKRKSSQNKEYLVTQK